MNIFKKQSLRTKLILPMSMIIIVIISASVIYMAINYRKMAVDYLGRDIQNRSQTLAYTVAMGLNDGNFDLVNYSFNSVKEDKNISLIAIIDENKEILIEYNPQKVKLDINNEIKSKDVKIFETELSITTPIVYNQKALGHTILKYSLRQMQEQLNASIIQGVMIFSIFLIIAIIVVVFVMKPIIKNIRILKDFALLVKSGNFKDNLILKSNDEIGELAQTFIGMMSTIQAIISEINRLTDEIKSGNLEARGYDDNFEGSYKDIIVGINTMFDNVLAPLQEISINVDLIAKGSLPQKISNSDYLKLTSVQSVNSLIDSIRLLIEESKNLANASIAGNLTFRSDASKLEGEFKGIVQGMNLAFDRLVGLIDNMPLPVQIKDNRYKILYSNAFAKKLNN